MIVSKYRLRLFLSVDLAGSTLYKAGVGSRPRHEGSPFPEWIATIRRFYRDFPGQLSRNFQKVLGGLGCASDIPCPTVWKLIGDEIVFCVKLTSDRHLAACVIAFVNSLKEYDGVLAADQIPLGVKGVGWVAAFPGLNMTASYGELNGADYLLESFEAAADATPKDYDFLGPQIDAGFRLARFSSQEQMAVSLELGWLLTRCEKGGVHIGKYYYKGREVLKGVLRDRPYPVVVLDADRDAERRLVLDMENRLLNPGQSAIAGWELHDFLTSYSRLENVELPLLLSEQAKVTGEELPPSYIAFRNNAEIEIKGIAEQEQMMQASSEIEDADEFTVKLPT